MTIHPCYIGCDISKAHIDFFDPECGRVSRIANRPEAIGEMLAGFAERSVFFIYEATGVYDKALRFALAEACIAGSRVNPTAAKRFAQATRRKAKTDALDARMLSDLGQRLTPSADPAPCPARERLGVLHRRRDQLVSMRAKEKVRLKDGDDAVVCASIKTMIEMLTGQIKDLAVQISALLDSRDDMRCAQALLLTAPGVGPVTATTMIALMPELGNASPKNIASLAGLAPFNHDSGKLRGKRCISGGRRRVRHALYLAALSAVRYCERYRRFYENLCRRCAAKKIALIAVARKLLIALNAMIRDQKQFL